LWKNVGEIPGLNAAQIKSYVDLLRLSYPTVSEANLAEAARRVKLCCRSNRLLC